jgi:hypothetical protein
MGEKAMSEILSALSDLDIAVLAVIGFAVLSVIISLATHEG